MKLMAALLLSASLVLAGCSGAPQGTGDGDRTTVAAALYPLAWATEQVGADGVTVTNLTTPGVEAHDVELTPHQVAALHDADLVVYLKGFQPAVDKAIEQAAPRRVLDVAQVAQLVDLADEGHEGGHTHDDGHDHGELDPHFWLDPTRLAKVTEAIAAELGQVVPERSAGFTSAAQQTAAALTTLDSEFAEGLATCERREFVVAHAAFGYLAHRYDLEQIAIAGLSPDAEPSPARVVEVQTMAQEHGVTTIFFETLTSPAVAESIAGDLGLKTAVLDPVEGLTDGSPGADYPAIMRSNLAALKAAGSCG